MERHFYHRRAGTAAIGFAATTALVLASGAGLAVFLLYSRVVRLPELPRAIDLARSAVRGR